MGALAKIDKFNSSIAVDKKLLSVDGVETKVTLDTSLKVVGAKDYNKDGAVDILLQHLTTGVAKIVYFDTAGTELSEKEIGTVDTTTLWEIRN